MIDEGKVYTESNNTINYLDQQYPQSTFSPKLKRDKTSVRLLIVLASKAFKELDWETPEPYALFNHYLDQREAEETDVNSAIWRA